MGAGPLGLIRRAVGPLLLLAAGCALPHAAHAAWAVCWFDDPHDHLLFYSAPFQTDDALRNQTIFEANVFMNGATTTPEVTCGTMGSRGAALARTEALARQARSSGEQPKLIPAE